VRRSSSGALEVLLVTSRETRRWVVPKGWPWRKVDDHKAAAGEAWEEAGVKGRAGRKSIGTFTYPKLRDGVAQLLEVKTYLLVVAKEYKTWPEVDQRQRQWFAPERAATLVAEPELKDILREIGKAFSSAPAKK
jgi:8-oxo-dGTP pyrophosphatase MutT (NUDIX family)